MSQIISISITPEEAGLLKEYYCNDTRHEYRQWAHTLLLFKRKFSIESISNILEFDTYYTTMLLKAWYYFKFDGFQAESIESIFNKIREKEKLKKQLPKLEISLLKIIGKSIYYLVSTFWSFLRLIITGILSLASKLSSIDFQRYYIKKGVSAKNVLNISENSNNNKIIQIGNIIVNSEGSFEEVLKQIPLPSVEEAKKVFFTLFSDKQEFLSSSLVLSLLIAFSKAIQKVKSEEKKKRYLSIIATAAAVYFLHHFAIKSGVFGIALLGFFIPITSLEEPKETESLPFEPEKKETIAKSHIKEDSTVQSTVGEHDESLNIEDLFAPNNDCGDLTEISTLQRAYISKDSTDYTTENYFIVEPDDKYYLHVAAYWDIKEAAFQREYLINQNYENCKIIELSKNGRPLYAVTIGDFEGGEILDLCELKQEWDDYCESSKSLLFHNN